jgi:hypothetical protein
MTSFYQQYKAKDIPFPASAPEDPKKAKSAFDINNWRFGISDKKEDELVQYLKAQLAYFKRESGP